MTLTELFSDPDLKYLYEKRIAIKQFCANQPEAQAIAETRKEMGVEDAPRQSPNNNDNATGSR